MVSKGAAGYGSSYGPYLSENKPEKHMNTQRILANEMEALCLMSVSDSFGIMEIAGTPEPAEYQPAGMGLPVSKGPIPDQDGSSPCLAFGDEDEDEDIEDEEDGFDDMEDDFDDDFDDDDEFDDDDDDFDDDDADEDDDYDYDDDADYDDDFEE
jgi:hypothetical protein